MDLNKTKTVGLFIVSILSTYPVSATTTYTYTNSTDSSFSGSFSVDSALADGTYHFLNADSRPVGFTENFFTSSFIDGRGVTRTPSLSLFDITISNALVSTWDIRASTTFTSITYSGGKKYTKVYHDNSVLIYHDTNIPYTPGNGLAYQATIANGDYKTYYTSGFAYQETLTGGINNGLGVWSIANTASSVTEPEAWLMFLFVLPMIAWGKRGDQK